MRVIISIIGVAVALLATVVESGANLPRAPYWHLVEVVDERTVKLRSDEGENLTITLACIGRAKDNRAAVVYITKRLRDQDLSFWALETRQTNWNARPMCLMLDLALPRGGELVYDFPTLNEELLAWGYAPYSDVKVTNDHYGLKARLVRAKQEWEKRQKDKDQRMKELEKKWKIEH